MSNKAPPAFLASGFVFAVGVMCLVVGYALGLDRAETTAFIEAHKVERAPARDAGAHCWTPPGDAPVFAARVKSSAVTRWEHEKEMRLYLTPANERGDEDVNCHLSVPSGHPYAKALEMAEPSMPVLIMLSMPQEGSEWR